ncbi:MAG: ankyrin repeat domain-containing protein [Brucellaceae bacterium]|nr:ankyrin repeat domain-containing protein [Brucellaceae bacterium]
MTDTSHDNSASRRLAGFRKAAKALKRAARAGDPQALARLAAVTTTKGSEVRHADCLHVVANEAGYGSWAALKFDVETAALDRAGRQQRLALALYEGWQPQVERLLAADPTLADGHIGLLAALYRREELLSLLDADPDAATKPVGRRTPLLHLTFSRFHRLRPDLAGEAPKIADMLLERGADIDDGVLANPDDDPETGHRLSALYGALGHAGNLPLARHLLERGANPDDNESFYHATELGHLDGVRLMMEFGAKLQGTNAFFRMLDFDNLEGAKLMLDHGADPNECPAQWLVAHRSERGNALHHAIRRGRDGRFVELLLDAGADPMALYLGHTAYAMARINGNAGAVRVLEARGLVTPLSDAERLLAAAAEGDMQALEALSGSTAGLIATLHPEDQAMHVELARVRGKLAALKGLIAAGFDPQFEDRHEKITALHGAAWWGLADHVEFLLGFPQDLEHRNVYGANALGTAIHGSRNCQEADRGDYERTVELLIAAGVSINPDRGDLLMGSEQVTMLVESALDARGGVDENQA